MADRSGGPARHHGREFFDVVPVATALGLLASPRVTPAEHVGLADLLGRTPVHAAMAPCALPGFVRSTVDGFAVRAADTFGASEGLPSYLEVAGVVVMGRPAEVAVRTGTAVVVPTGAAIPAGADAVVMVEHTQVTIPGSVEVVRPVAPGEGTVRADEDVAAGATLAVAGRPLRAHDLGLLAAAGVVEVAVHRRPRVGIVSTGDEVVEPSTRDLAPGQVRDATASALAAMVVEAGGEPLRLGIVGDEAAALEAVLRGALTRVDLLVVSAGSSVGARDETATVVARLGSPGILCHGLALRPGKPTLLADCGGVPVIGLPGNPLSALVVFRLVGVPLVRRVGGTTALPPEPTVPAVLDRQVPSQAGRRDIVQVRVRGQVATPLFGASALLSVLTAADGFVTVPEDATGLPIGAEVDVTLYR